MTVDNSKVLVVGETEIVMDAPVRQRLEFGGLIIARVYPADKDLSLYPRDRLNRNVYAYDSSGRLIWQIQEAPHGGTGKDKAYMHLKTCDQSLVAGNWIGIDYQVTLENGKVTPLKQGARPW